MAQLQSNTQTFSQTPADKVSSVKNLITMLLGTWLIIGFFIDGYAHNHGAVESFFTPWHAILYSGFVATASWLLWIVYQNKRSTGLPWLKAIPKGYGLGVAGVFVFLSGGLGDLYWHTVFGIEEGFSALLSPSHLLLLLGALLILSSPFRVGWRKPEQAPTWKQFFPTLMSATLSAMIVSFFLMYTWTFVHNIAAQPNVDQIMEISPFIVEAESVRGILSILLHTLQMMFPIVLIMSRWKVPLGSFTFYMTFLSTMMSALYGFYNWQGILFMLAGGVAADLLFHTLKPDRTRIWSYRLIAIVVPLVVWSLYFLFMEINVGIGWPPEVWSGSLVLAALASLGLSVLAVPPAQEGS
ncbi:hypothetical protein I6N90_24365 [Paenibacillus sp. GSMTC-2017]|uniref:hypothetical protein n=1 Tax=Paenibacillus sp. GSMTC-2017 TaxID=2794350 RepID=UPI0018D98660|nr:hypothetical protein [Paenibacillus sp. GSMTC-2017]MBH5320924.1 hypothetical protein [Paenibacillus sp. GSMTC-2017]